MSLCTLGALLHSAVSTCGCAAGRAPAGARPAASSQEEPCFQTPPRMAPKWLPKPMDPDGQAKLKDCPGKESGPECKFKEARAYFDHRHFERSGPLFLELALDPASGELGLVSAQLYLESASVIGTHSDPPRVSCFRDISSHVREFSRLYCEGNPGDRREPCQLFGQMAFDFERMEALKLAERAGAGPPNARELHEQAGDRYRALFDRGCRRQGPDAALVQPDRVCAEVIYNALVAFRAAGAKDKAQATRAALLDPKNGLDHSELARKVAGEAVAP